jgi:hypothetical protein
MRKLVRQFGQVKAIMAGLHRRRIATTTWPRPGRQDQVRCVDYRLVTAERKEKATALQ